MIKRKAALATAAFMLSAAMLVSPAAVFAESEGEFDVSTSTDETFTTVGSEAEQQAVEEQKAARAAGNWKVYAGDIKPALDEDELSLFSEAHEAAGFYVEAYEPAAVLAKQVVNGTNYAYLCRLIPVGDYEPAWRIAVVHEDLDGKTKMLSLRDLYLNSLAKKGSKDGEGLLGAYTMEEDSEESTDNDDLLVEGAAGEALQAVLKENASLTPEALLGTEEAGDGKGQYFLYLCKGRLQSSDSSDTLCLLEIRADVTKDTDGKEKAENISLTGIDVLDLNAYVSNGPRTFITGNGALSIVLPDLSWKAVEDPKHLASFSDKSNRIELSHLVNGEEFPAVLIAGDKNAAVFQNYYSTPAEVFIATGIVNKNDAGDIVKNALQSVTILRYGFEPADPSQAQQPGPSATPTPNPTSDSRGDRTGYEAIVYYERSNSGTSILEYTNGNWYDVNGGRYAPGTGIERGYVWYDTAGNPLFLFPYPPDLTRTENNFNVTWPDGTQNTLIEYSDGIWRDSRYVQYVYNGDETWTGADGSIVYGSGPEDGQSIDLDEDDYEDDDMYEEDINYDGTNPDAYDDYIDDGIDDGQDYEDDTLE